MSAEPQIAIALLRRLRAALEANEPVPADVAAWVADALRRYEREAPGGLDLGRAFGLVPDPGGLSWWAVEARRCRDQKIRELYDRHYTDMRIAPAAREISRLARTYQASAWRADRQQPVTVTPDPRKALVAEALRTGQPFPGERQIETILRN